MQSAGRNTLWLLIILAGAGALIVWLFPVKDIDVPQDSTLPRIVTLSPAIAVILDDLGLSEQIVGRHAYDIVLDSSVPIVGDMTGIDYERLLRLRPTHILLEHNAQPLPERLQLLADDNGWMIRSMPMLTLEDIPLATEQLTQLFESPQTRERLMTLLDNFNSSMQPSLDASGRAGRVLPLYWTNPPGAAGPGSFHHQMLERLGFEMALTDGGAYITVDPEDILRMDPDSILLLMPGADSQRLDELLGPLQKLDLRCVREGRVGVINDPMVNLPATSIIEIAKEITRITLLWAPPTPIEAN